MLKNFMRWITRLPNVCGVDASRQSNPWDLHFWYRQFFHALGGFIIAYLLTSVHVALFCVFWVGMMGVVIIKEDGDAERGQGRFKTVVDFLMWMAGGIVGGWAAYSVKTFTFWT